jgi:hypothetical protein
VASASTTISLSAGWNVAMLGRVSTSGSGDRIRGAAARIVS